MSIFQLLYGSDTVELALDIAENAAERERHLALPVCTADHVLEPGERWMMLAAPAKVGDIVYQHIILSWGRDADTSYASCRYPCTTNRQPGRLITHAMLTDGGWLPGYWLDGEDIEERDLPGYWRAAVHGQQTGPDGKAVYYRWSIIRKAVR